MKKVAILLGEGYEDSEFIYPYYRLLEAGIGVDVLALQTGTVTGKHGTTFKTVLPLCNASSGYDGLYIPGGKGPEELLRDEGILGFVRSMQRGGKTLCAVCHGPLVLASAGILEGRSVTGYPAIKEKLLHSGALFTGSDVEVDGEVITAKDPSAMPQMMRAWLAKLGMD